MLGWEAGHDFTNGYRRARNQYPAPRERYPAVVEASLRGAARSFFSGEIPAAASELPSGEPRNVAGRLRDFAMVSDRVHQHRKRDNARRTGSDRAGVEAGGRRGTNQRSAQPPVVDFAAAQLGRSRGARANVAAGADV